MPTSRKTRGIACTIAGSSCWAFSGVCAQFLFERYDVGELWLTATRLIVAGIVFIGIAFAKNRSSVAGIVRERSSLLHLILFAFFGVLFCQVSYMFTIAATNAATATVIQSLGLLLIMLYGCARVRRRPTKREFLALALALAGIFLVCTNGNPASLALSPVGIAWGGITAVSLALYTLLPGTILDKWGSFPVTGWAMLLAGVALCAIVRPWETPPALDGAGLLAFAAVTVIGTLCAYGLYLQGIADIGPLKAGLFGAAEPIAACLISVVWLHMSFSPATLLGFALIVIMGYIVSSESG